MRINNVKCIICEKDMYRRPFEIKKARYFACKEHREIAKLMFPVTDKQKEALKLWRTDNHLTWIPKTQSHKDNISRINKEFYSKNPEVAIARWLQTSWEKHYYWKWWVTKLQIAIRTSARNRNWIKKIKDRDNNECRLCQSKDNLEVHHIMPMSKMIEKYNIKTHKDTYIIDDFWDIDNWITVCSKCHSLVDNKRKW